jgi:hypothetical protein
MKKRSSLKTRTCELFPLVVSKITAPVQSPCHGQADRQTSAFAEQSMNMQRGNQGGSFFSRVLVAYDDERGDGLVQPPVLLDEVAEDDAGAEQRDEQVDGDHRGVVGGRAQHAQAHQVRRQAGSHNGGLAAVVAFFLPADPAGGDCCSGRRRDPPREKTQTLYPHLFAPEPVRG